MLEFRILGPLEIVDGGADVPLSGRNQRALVALLLVHANEALSTDRIVDRLWGEHPPRTATTSLQNTVSQLRKLLGPGLLQTRPNGYALEIDAGQLDLGCFEELLDRARAAEPDERAVLLHEALALWRGPPFADLQFETFLQQEIQRLESLRLAALEERIAADLELRADAELVAEVEALVREHPLQERLRAHLMLALYRTGRQADALEVYHDTRRTLVEELGIEPGPELQALYGSILRQERSLVSAPAPSLDDHYDEVMRALCAGRLVPVLGPGAAPIGGTKLLRLLGERFDVDVDGHGLAFVTQAIAARNGIGPLYDELHRAYASELEPTALHRWLARLPALLRDRGLPQQLIVSTGFDAAVEHAFAAAAEPLDVVLYVGSGRYRGKFLHLAPDGGATVVDEPNAYAGLALDERPVLLKIHGHVEPGETRELESFVVREDDHIDYLVGGDVAAVVPVQLAARLRRSHLLFLGYAVEDWSLRVFVRRVWGGDRLTYRSWAVQPEIDPIAAELWRERGVEAYDVSLDLYAEQLERLTADAAAEEVV